MTQSALRRTPPPGAVEASWGCDWCHQRPAYQVTIEPATYAGKRLISAARHAVCCVPCAAFMQLDLAGARSNAEQIELRKMLAADKRAQRRQAMRRAQTSLF